LTDIAMVVVWILLGLFSGQAILVWGFVKTLDRWRDMPLEDDCCPKVAVILCLRGTDPFLENCLRGVINLDYPQFELFVVVDNQDDPAWEVVTRVVGSTQSPKVHIQELIERLDTCSLKCSSLVQVISRLDETYEVAALLDADTVPDSNWLRQLVAPLMHETVGVTTGNRWYAPVEPSFATLVRYCWNSAAIVQMFWYHIAWGGTMAIKLSIVRSTDLLDRWRTAFCEDTMLYKTLRRHRLRVAFVPSLLMVNRESCDMSGFFHWVSRQLLTARLYHPQWTAVLAHGVSAALVSVIGLTVLVCALIAKDWTGAFWVSGGLIGYQLALLSLLIPLESAARKILRPRGQATIRFTPACLAKTVTAAVVLQLVYPAAILSAVLTRRVRWRGIDYRIGGPRDIRLVEYQPFRCVSDGDNVVNSL